mmetsp:Transcript_21186/g.50874  ORF Transcript_21186/g.50874 Transcript_21186/m.50874 type:complete len:92 (+) Transcript_21186:112-387(+)
MWVQATLYSPSPTPPAPPAAADAPPPPPAPVPHRTRCCRCCCFECHSLIHVAPSCHRRCMEVTLFLLGRKKSYTLILGSLRSVLVLVAQLP